MYPLGGYTRLYPERLALPIKPNVLYRRSAPMGNFMEWAEGPSFLEKS
ncbi:1057_t:CDS:2 [Rhizophagus irregularis]|nr:1057_t:CDS:2 [Rhizophagus irregularis]